MDLIKVGIADPSILFREGLKRVLAPESDLLLVGEAKEETEATRIVQRTRPDVLLLDLMIPPRGAVPVLLELKQRSISSKVFVLCLPTDEDSVLETGKAGAHGYALKCILPRTLIQAVRRIHRGEIWADRQLGCAETFVKFACELRASNAADLEHQITKLLSKREIEILALVANGLTNDEISKKLFISVTTVKIHLNHIFGKLNVKNRLQAALVILQQCGELVREVGLKYQGKSGRSRS
jgi:DNA-binding NarL/FixJ family response regulator